MTIGEEHFSYKTNIIFIEGKATLKGLNWHLGLLRGEKFLFRGILKRDVGFVVHVLCNHATKTYNHKYKFIENN